jgi:hypothetical protein
MPLELATNIDNDILYEDLEDKKVVVKPITQEEANSLLPGFIAIYTDAASRLSNTFDLESQNIETPSLVICESNQFEELIRGSYTTEPDDVEGISPIHYSPLKNAIYLSLDGTKQLLEDGKLRTALLEELIHALTTTRTPGKKEGTLKIKAGFMNITMEIAQAGVQNYEFVAGGIYQWGFDDPDTLQINARQISHADRILGYDSLEEQKNIRHTENITDLLVTLILGEGDSITAYNHDRNKGMTINKRLLQLYSTHTKSNLI